MPRLGGGSYKQSYLVGGSSGSQTQVMTGTRTPTRTPPPSGNRRPSEYVLPTRTDTPMVSAPNTTAIRRVKASEPGSGSLLPTSSSQPVSRVRTLSDMHSVNSAESDDSPAPGLRRRSTMSLDDESIDRLHRRNSLSSQSLPLHSSPRNANSPSPMSRTVYVNKGFTLGHLLQLAAVIVTFYLVFDAHSKVQEASHRLEHYKEEEAMLIDQMDRIEDRAVQLQEQLKTLRDDQRQPQLSKVDEVQAETANAEKEVHHWKRSYFQVNKEVHALQDYLQQGARQELSDRYGTGVIHINLDLGLPANEGGLSQLSIELFDESPHSSWVFLQQIESGDWKDAKFIWHPGHMVLASPVKAASTKFEFVEKTYHRHDAWTVGLTPSHNGGYNLYVNLEDNSHVHEGDVCLGKVVGGFDALQKLLHIETVSQQPGGEKAFLKDPVAISNMDISSVKRSKTRRY